MDKIAESFWDGEDEMDEDDDVMHADTIAVMECDGDCAAHILFHDEDGSLFAEAAISHQMAYELGEILMRLGRSETKTGTSGRRLHA